MLDNGNYNWIYDYMKKGVTDSFKHSTKLKNLFSKGQSFADKIEQLKHTQITVVEDVAVKKDASLGKTFTLTLQGELNTDNKEFMQEIASKFDSILESYKKQKILELSEKMDSVIKEMNDLFPSSVQFSATTGNGVGLTYTNDSSNPILNENVSSHFNKDDYVIGSNVNWVSNI